MAPLHSGGKPKTVDDAPALLKLEGQAQQWNRMTTTGGGVTVTEVCLKSLPIRSRGTRLSSPQFEFYSTLTAARALMVLLHGGLLKELTGTRRDNVA